MAVHTVTTVAVTKPGSPPDIDTDYNTHHRETIVENIRTQYGTQNTARIGTRGMLKAKSSFKDMATIYGAPFKEANRISGLIPGPRDGKECSLNDLYDPESGWYPDGAPFREATATGVWARVVTAARAIEGRTKSVGTHACGVILSSHPLSDIVPVATDKNHDPITEYEYAACENLGLIKIDFLGLDTVDIIQNTVQLIQETTGEAPNMPNLVAGALDDKPTYDLLGRGDTVAVFQLSSPGVQELLRKMRPTRADHIAAITALYRPGPMGMEAHTKYADRIGGREPIEPIHPDFAGTVLDSILEPTASLIVFQEQVIEIAQKISGFTGKEGDKLRKAIGKKQTSVMESMRTKFLDGGARNGYSREAMLVLWDKVVEFSKYAFNKCFYGRTKVLLDENTKITVKDLYSRWEHGERDIKIMSMKEDGSFELHRVAEIVETGVKPLWTVKTASGRTIRITEDHRMLTTDGYRTVKDGGLAVGVELIHDPNWNKRFSDEVRRKRSNHMIQYNKSDKNRKKSKERMTYYQSTLSFEDRSKHQKRISKVHPERGFKVAEHMRKALRDLWANDPEWAKKTLEKQQVQRSRGAYKRRGYGKPTAMNDGRIADSICEAVAGNYLLSRGVDFEVHKIFTSINGTIRVTDFYADGLYFEMDGLRRGRQWFVENKYGNDIPFVYLTPENYRDEIDAALMRHHIENGDPIVEIIPPKTLKNGSVLREMTYDIMMADDGPANFVANGLVSHNSHSVAYTMLAYQTAYLKANHPVEFMATCVEQALTAGHKEKRFAYVKEAQRMGIVFEGINVNASGVRVAPNPRSPGTITYSFPGVNGVSTQAAELIVAERERGGLFTGVDDFIHRCYRAGVTNRRVFENIAAAGGFDVFGASRRQVVESVEGVLSGAKHALADTDDIFTGSGVTLGEDYSGEDYDFLDRLRREGMMLGVYLSGHPLDGVPVRVPGAREMLIRDVLRSPRFVRATIMGAVSSLSVVSRGGRRVTTLGVEDGSGFLTARLSRAVEDAVLLWERQQAVKDAYLSGGTVSSVVADAVRAATSVGVAPVVEHGVYSFDVVFTPSSGDGGSGFVSVVGVRPVRLGPEGGLPVRVRFDAARTPVGEDPRAVLRSLLGRVKEECGTVEGGGVPVWWAGFSSRSLGSRVDTAAVFRDALTVLDAGGQGGGSWPPPAGGVDSEYRVPYETLVDALPYRDAGFRVEKNNRLDGVLGELFGAADYDYGTHQPMGE